MESESGREHMGRLLVSRLEGRRDTSQISYSSGDRLPIFHRNSRSPTVEWGSGVEESLSGNTGSGGRTHRVASTSLARVPGIVLLCYFGGRCGFGC